MEGYIAFMRHCRYAYEVRRPGWTRTKERYLGFWGVGMLRLGDPMVNIVCILKN